MNELTHSKFERTSTRFGISGTRALVVALLLVCAQAAPAHSTHSIPYMTPASNEVQQGFVRIINRSDREGTVEIHATDDSGNRVGPVTLSLGSNETVNFNSGELENGNASKGLPEGVGDGEGNWRLELDTMLDIDPLGYIRTANGFVTSLHDIVEDGLGAVHHVVFFNPASNTEQLSLLRIANLSEMANDVVIEGRDDRGLAPPDGHVSFTLADSAARTISAVDLENGGDGLEGHFGDGTGKWQLFITAKHPILVMNLMQSDEGKLSNLSGTTARVEPGRYFYTRTGADRGTITVTGDFDSSFCTINLQFSSATTGSIVPVVTVHATDYAPANRAEFEDLFDNVSSSYNFSGGRFTDSGYRGNYEYRKLWPNVAGLLLSYNDSRGYAYYEKCTVIATFESANAGNFAAYCNECTLDGCEDEYFSPRRWEISGALEGLSPEDNDAFNDNFCGKRLTIREAGESVDANPDYHIDFIDTGVLRTSSTLVQSEFCHSASGTWQFEIQ